MGFIAFFSSSNICRLKGNIIARYFNAVSFIFYFDTPLPTMNIKLLLLSIYISSFTILTCCVDEYFNFPLNCLQTCNKYVSDGIFYPYAIVSFLLLL